MNAQAVGDVMDATDVNEAICSPWYTRGRAPVILLGALILSMLAMVAWIISLALTPKAAPPQPERIEPGQEVAATPPEARPDPKAPPKEHRAAFIVSDAWGAFPEPKRGDWAYEYNEPMQSVASYISSTPNLVDGDRRVLYLRTTSDSSADRAIEMASLRDFMAAYFQLEVRLMKPMDVSKITRRTREEGYDQMLTPDLLDAMIEEVPEDAYAVLAVTTTDLYPEEDWNFVFGQARFKDRVGVYSVARFHADFFAPGAKTPRQLLTRRIFGIVAHETGHMFSIRHCKYFHCAMNGTNSLAESDRGTLHLCPVCARKLYHAHRYDPRARYEQLASVYEEHGLEQEATWARERVEALDAAQTEPSQAQLEGR